MKRIFSCVICVLLLLSFLTGCKKEPEYYSDWISVYESLPADSEETVSADDSSSAELLSAEDKALKAEIAKISDTKVDFRANKKQNFCGKNYDLKFLDMGANLTGTSVESTLNNQITYVADDKNRFIYDVKTGGLKTVIIESYARYKDSNSITEEKALQIAEDYINKNYNHSGYALDSVLCNEQMGYIMTYSKHICGYATEDSIGFTIDFAGNICFMNIATGMFDDFEIESINEAAMLDKLKAQVGENVNYTVDKQRLIVKDEIVYMEYSITVNSENYSSSWLYAVPIE
ncbi:MAG: hypothetical protein IJZ75_04700 [Clostridia bacterium]|nr:hypothetical protein [Clostridia bacterium]